MYAHERSLVEKLKDRPFALIGVNTDNREKVKQVIKEEKITWRSFWDGEGPRGPIASAWDIQNWPSLFVLDAGGVIRFKELSDEKEIDAAIDELLKEMGQ